MSYGWSTDEHGNQGSKRTKMSHHNISITSWDINDSLAADFDGSLSGLGNDIGSATYNMRFVILTSNYTNLCKLCYLCKYVFLLKKE